jgi:hypothetical protein
MRGQFDLSILQACVTSRRIDRQAAGDDRGRMSWRPGWPTPQQRANARDELANAEWLGQVIVGAALESEYLVRLLAPGGEHQDRHIAIH